MYRTNSEKSSLKFRHGFIFVVLLTHENNEIKSPTKIYDFTVDGNS